MTLKGQVTSDSWNVTTGTFPADGGFGCEIHVGHAGAGEEFKHQFRHSKIFATEREAVLDGLREGMVWISLKLSETIHL
ncbi:hypothetical protein SAMN05414139_10421 [Burkholderia sp. D7]|nr:hypothetical protein SAMN05414139_10421 [Burkholderia sp. D7]